MKPTLGLAATLLFVGFVSAAAAELPEWPQYGGPHRNWSADSKGLANSWPASGPKKLWSRPLGDGYSGIAVDNGVLYTMFRKSEYRKSEQEVVTALAANTGKTLWEYAYDAAFLPRMGMEHGPGPHTTPLILGDYVYTVGILAKMHCFEKKSGKPIWTKDLYQDFPGSTFMGRGYSSSPLAYKNTIILQIGGPGHAIIALNPKDGYLLWAKQDFSNSPNSPMLIKVNGQDQLVAFFNEPGAKDMGGLIAGLNPDNGDILWSHRHPTNWGLNISLPVWSNDNILFVSCAYSGGSRALELKLDGSQTTVRELWHNNRMRVHHGTMVRIGDTVYGSSGDFGPAPFTAIDVKTGAVKWQDRSFPKATFVYADGKFILLDEDGNLALTTVSPDGLKVLSKVSLLANNAWTPPALAGTKLYLRDRRTIMALDLQ